MTRRSEEPPDLGPLLEAAVNGDGHALAELVRRTQPVVWRVCVALGSPGEVEDLVQETYLRALRSLPSFRGDAPVQAWLLSVARNVCADHVRHRNRRARLLERLRAQRREWTDHQAPVVAVNDLLRTLTAERREAFVLTQLCGLSYEDTALICDCPVGTIRSRVARARADLLALVDRADAR